MKYMISVFKYLMLAVLMLFPGLSGDAQAMDASEKDPDMRANSLPPIDRKLPKAYETFSFGLGWFWGIESQFGIIDGVIRTRVGYAGGNTDSPTYRSMGDHTETVQVDFNPETISFSRLLERFWNSHNYTRQTGITQYKNAIFFHNEEQRKQAMASKKTLEESTGNKVRTDIVPLKSFTPAEDYHQKYLLKHSALKHMLDDYYPRHSDLVDSTAAARLNGYAGQNGTKAQLLRELQSLGLSEKEGQILKNLVGD